ncbi:MAG: SRPBCC family protein [Candidatus Altimarinota bacterium]
MQAITIETIVNAPLDHVWKVWNEPEHIMNWAFASDDWHAPRSENDLKVGGKFSTTMAAKDGSVSFDFGGIYTAVKTNELIEYDMDDKRHVKIQFEQLPEGAKVIQTFDMEDTNPEEMQRNGWQAILDNFKKYAESTK